MYLYLFLCLITLEIVLFRLLSSHFYNVFIYLMFWPGFYHNIFLRVSGCLSLSVCVSFYCYLSIYSSAYLFAFLSFSVQSSPNHANRTLFSNTFFLFHKISFPRLCFSPFTITLPFRRFSPFRFYYYKI